MEKLVLNKKRFSNFHEAKMELAKIKEQNSDMLHMVRFSQNELIIESKDFDFFLKELDNKISKQVNDINYRSKMLLQ